MSGKGRERGVVLHPIRKPNHHAIGFSRHPYRVMNERGGMGDMLGNDLIYCAKLVIHAACKKLIVFVCFLLLQPLQSGWIFLM